MPKNGGEAAINIIARGAADPPLTLRTRSLG
jgi:hypothetical protein